MTLSGDPSFFKFKTNHVQFIIDPRKLLRTTFYIVAFLCAMHVAQYLAETFMPGMIARKMASTFNLDYEHNVPTFFSFVQLWAAALILVFIASWASRERSRDARYWWVLAAMFVYLGVDELEEIHEIPAKILRTKFHLTGVLYYAWVIPAALACLAVGLFFLRFVLRLPTRTRNGVIVSGTAFVFSAIVGDMVSGYFFSHFGGGNSLAMMIENIVEEAGEMLSIAYFIHTLLCYYQEHIGQAVKWDVKKENGYRYSVNASGQVIEMPRRDGKSKVAGDSSAWY
jgi:hypothetical protein